MSVCYVPSVVYAKCYPGPQGSLTTYCATRDECMDWFENYICAVHAHDWMCGCDAEDYGVGSTAVYSYGGEYDPSGALICTDEISIQGFCNYSANPCPPGSDVCCGSKDPCCGSCDECCKQKNGGNGTGTSSSGGGS
jgi:hypothetical protein